MILARTGRTYHKQIQSVLQHHNLPSRSNFSRMPSQSPSISTTTTSSSTTTPMDVLANSDPEQVRLMAERVILVDPKDQVTGHMSKKEAHLQANDLPLHRAFSVFLFDSEGRMLLQQRAPTKVTFPSFWTNTVCSHPLYTPLELGTDSDAVVGTKHAALRKLSHELGVREGDVSVHDLHYMTRILYRAPCDDAVWGEHELDYVFFAQKDVPIDPQPNEVCNVKYVTVSELKHMFSDSEARVSDGEHMNETGEDKLKLTPWFKHIVESFGWEWWKLLLEKGTGSLHKARDSETIHVMR